MEKLQGKTNNWPTVDFPRVKKGEVQKYHGWYSETYKNADQKYIIYLNENGKEVVVTGVTISARPCNHNDDIEYKGVMVKWVRSVSV